MVRIGLVGLGDAGGHHADALSNAEGVRWVAICARTDASMDRFSEARDVPDSVQRIAGFEQLLDAGVCDAVVLATPDAFHADQIVACANAGVSVLVEKPLALSSVDARRAVEACRESGVVLSVGYHLRHHAGHRRVREVLTERIGALRRIAVRWAWPDPASDGWRAQGTLASTWSLAALGTHGIDLAMWLAGSSEVEDHAMLFDPPRGIDRASELSFRLRPGTLVHVSASVTHRAPSVLRLSGDEGEILCERTLGARGGGRIVVTHGRSEPETLEFVARHPYPDQLADFARCVSDGTSDDERIRAAVENVRLIEGARRRT